MIRELEKNFFKLFNGNGAAAGDVPVMPEADFQAAVIEGIRSGGRLLSFFASPHRESPLPELWAVMGDDSDGSIYLGRMRLFKNSFSSLTPYIPQAHMFEREIYEEFHVRPEGHPWLKPLRFSGSRGDSETPLVGVIPYYTVRGEEIHEVGVGPVHAGVIEPGHFRFQCYGEQVLHLEISLGYQHRGVEEALRGGPFKHSAVQIEAAAGDTSIGHAWAYCTNVEALSGALPSARAQVLRAIALELERLANHTGDLGALAGDVGFLPVAAFCGRLRGDFLNMTALLCGNRFGRSLLCPGGVRWDLNETMGKTLHERLRTAFEDVEGAGALLWETSGATGRFENTGVVSEEQCKEVGLVGVAARACGVERDVRTQYPWGPYRFSVIAPAIVPGGDVNARVLARWLEIARSKDFIEACLDHLAPGPLREEPKQISPDMVAVSLTEGWRGEICHVAISGSEGKFWRYKITDPSFHNWFGLALALRGQQISDFPLCNKSFNLSYCGFDL